MRLFKMATNQAELSRLSDWEVQEMQSKEIQMYL